MLEVVVSDIVSQGSQSLPVCETNNEIHEGVAVFCFMDGSTLDLIQFFTVEVMLSWRTDTLEFRI